MAGGPKAYSYLRFSTPEQSLGDSFRRQSVAAEEYALRNDLLLDSSLTFRDLGISAFRGTNARHGALGAFLKAVDEGLVPEGSVLLVESLDRVSRQDPWDALPVFQQIINAGITIVTLQDGKAWSRAELTTNPFRIMESLVVMIRANEESATKAKRLRAAWYGKRLKAANGVGMTARCPAWLRLDRDTGQYEPIPDRASVISRIFQLASEGVGQHAIAAKLNRDGVATFGTGGRRAEFWNRSYIAKIIESPAVAGIGIPHTIEYVDGRKRRVPGDPIANYFPVVVDPDLLARVQASRSSQRAPATRMGHAETSNLLAGLASCPWCGATMTRVSKGKKGGKPRLTCVRAKIGACKGVSVPQDEVEAALIHWADKLARVPSNGDDWAEAHHELVQKIRGYERLIQTATNELLDRPSPAIRERLAQLEAEQGRAKSELREVEVRAIAAGPGLVRAASDLHVALTAATLNRGRVNSLLRQAFDYITVDGEQREMRLVWKHGVEQVLPLNSPAAPRQPQSRLAGATPLADAALRSMGLPPLRLRRRFSH